MESAVVGHFGVGAQTTEAILNALIVYMFCMILGQAVDEALQCFLSKYAVEQAVEEWMLSLLSIGKDVAYIIGRTHILRKTITVLARRTTKAHRKRERCIEKRS